MTHSFQFFCDNAEQLCTLLQRTDLVVEYFKYRHLLVLVKGRAEMMMNNRMKPRPSLAKVITFGSLQAERCFSTEMLRTNSEHEKWIELPDIAGTERIGKCRNMSFAYFGKDRIIVTGGFEKSRPKQVSEMSTKRLPNFHSRFFFSHSLTAASDFIRSETTNDHRAAKNECGKRGSCIGDGQ